MIHYLGPVKELVLKLWRWFLGRTWYIKTLVIAGVIIALHWLYLLILILIFPPITMTQIGSLTDGLGLRREYVPLSEISYQLGLAVMASEDQVFPDHFGLDFESIEKAVEFNKTHRRTKHGASTISQQVAKNVFLWQGRSWIRKGLEVYFTFMIELLWTKERILSMYLNTIEMGPGIFGAEAASQYYFKKSSSKLTRNEAALIAACLPNPKRFHPNAPSPWIQQRQNWIVIQMSQIESDQDVIAILSSMNHR